MTLKGKETEFMTELHDLFRKYSVDTVVPLYIGKPNETHSIIFMSKGIKFAFSDYSAGAFHDATVRIPKYTPYMEDDDE